MPGNALSENLQKSVLASVFSNRVIMRFLSVEKKFQFVLTENIFNRG